MNIVTLVVQQQSSLGQREPLAISSPILKGFCRNRRDKLNFIGAHGYWRAADIKKGDKMFRRITKEYLCLMGRTRPQQRLHYSRDVFLCDAHPHSSVKGSMTRYGGEQKKLVHFALDFLVCTCAILLVLCLRERLVCARRHAEKPQHNTRCTQCVVYIYMYIA